ncbi:MFS transporter [Paludibacterium sp.]|uniref:MFS transporter n=1 Tax=Paludibacterium sp. TaxID=1917523 RepID=UPI0025EC55B8|nr:MFS transporter [Paludibacterium sp.]MBV8647867.1 MFS transporter [Paludibacterium sp.]
MTTRSSRLALASLSLSLLLSSLDTSIANISLPTLARVFDAPFQTVQWVVLAYLLTITALIVSAGRLGDLFGRRRLLLAGILSFTATSALCGAAPTVALLIAARALQGLGAAALIALSMALVGDAVPKEQTGRAMGLLGTMSALGTTLGPSLGGMLIAGFGWRALFWINVPLGLATFALASRHLPADRRDAAAPAPRFDHGGTLLLALTLAAYALSMTLGRGQIGPRNLMLLAAALSGAAGFVWWELRAKAPLMHLAWLREPALGAGLAASALVATVVMSTLVVGPFYLTRGLGMTTALVGLTLSAGPLVAALSGMPAGRLVDRLGAGRMVGAGLAGMALGATLLAVLPASLGVIGYMAPVMVITAHYALFQAANNTAVMRGIPADRRGVVSGMLNLARNLGLISGASLMGAVFAHATGSPSISSASPAAVADGMRATFAVAACLLAAALLFTLAQRQSGRGQPA